MYGGTEKSRIVNALGVSSFEEYFKSVNNPLDPFFTPDEDVIHFNERYVNNEFCIMFDELNESFLQEEILKSIKQLKTNKLGYQTNLSMNFFIPFQKCISTCLVFSF